MPDILDFSVSVVFLDDLGNLDASLSRFFSLATDRTLEPSVPTKREKKGMKVEIMGFN